MKPRPESACSRALSQHSTNQRASPHGGREGIRAGCAARHSTRAGRVELVHRDVTKRQTRSDQRLPHEGGLARLPRPEHGDNPARRLHETAGQGGGLGTLEPGHHRKLPYLFQFTQCRNSLIRNRSLSRAV